MYLSRESTCGKTFDSTDKILDEIDAKLNGVASQSNCNQPDVNDDPGTDVQSVQKLRNHIDFNPSSSYDSTRMNGYRNTELQSHGNTANVTFFEGITENSTDAKNPRKIFHEKRTNLLQLYDDDINVLRRMLRENADEPKPSTTLERSCVSEKETAADSTQVPNEVKSVAPTVHWSENLVQVEEKPMDVSEHEQQLLDVSTFTDDTQCSCGCEDELEQITKERDELRARIRRGEASRTSIEERQELERQLHSTKTALFQERKKSRQQLEDIEEKLEEADHYYEEKLSEKEEIISSLQEKLSLLTQSKEKTEAILPDRRLEEELRNKEIEIKQLTDLSTRAQKEVDELKQELNNEVRRADESVEGRLLSERKRWEAEYKELKLNSDKEKFEHENNIRRLEQEREKMYEDVLELTEKLQEFRIEIDEKESRIKEENQRKENDYKATNQLLKHKIESLKEELSLAFASKSELELEIRRKENAIRQEFHVQEVNLKDENKRLEKDLKRMQSEVGEAVTKLKEFKSGMEHQDQCMAASVHDECHKLMHLLQSIQPNSNKPKTSYPSKNNLNGKKSINDLQEVVELVCRAANELICDVTRLKRETRKRPDYHSLRSNSDANLASEEVKILRDKLTDKENELQHLEVNMNQWKDLTAQRLAEKFQEELQLQVERKLSQYRSDHVHKTRELKPEMKRFSKSTSNLNGNSQPPNNDTSTVKLLCHLQGRVKQLRTENDLLRSSSFIKGLNTH